MEELREEVLGKRRVYPDVCSKLLSKTIDLEVKLLLKRKVILPPCEGWDSGEHPILTNKQLDAENERISEILEDLRELDKKLPVKIDRVISKAKDISNVVKILKAEKHSELLKSVNSLEK